MTKLELLGNTMQHRYGVSLESLDNSPDKVISWLEDNRLEESKKLVEWIEYTLDFCGGF